MTFQDILTWLQDHPLIFLPIVLILAYLLYRLTKYVLARGLFKIAIATETIYDDLIVDHLRPFRVAWLVPLGLLYAYSYFAMGSGATITNIVLFLIIVVAADFLVALLSGLNEVYKHRPTYTGASVAAYFNLLQVLVVVGAAFLVIALFAKVAPAVLLGGLGAWLAVLLLIFRDTILNFLASIQISSQELVRDGDWIEVPSYDTNGIVSGISLNAIKVKNFDNTVTVIPTYKIVDVAFKNWRAMEESGGRRIIVSLTVDTSNIRFCDLALLEKLSPNPLIADYVKEQASQLEEHQLEKAGPDSLPLGGPQITNVQLFMKYIEAYLKTRKDLRQRRFPFIVRVSEPGPAGVPIDIFVFTKKIPWAEYEVVRGDILLHLLAAAPYFGLSIYQQPAAEDFSPQQVSGAQQQGWAGSPVP